MTDKSTNRLSILRRPGSANFAVTEVLGPHVVSSPVRPGTNPGKHAVTAAPVLVTPGQWEQLLGLIASGALPDDAFFVTGVDPVALEGLLRADASKLRAWREAFIAAERRAWPFEILNGICQKVAEGATLRKACDAFDRNRLSFMTIMRRDPALKTMYEEARAIAAELEADDLRVIADENQDDILDDGKGGLRGNTAAVARSKLRVDTRLRLMGSFNRDRFAEKRDPPSANVTINVNAAERLESARARAKAAREPVVLEGEVVDLDAEWINS